MQTKFEGVWTINEDYEEHEDKINGKYTETNITLRKTVNLEVTHTLIH